MTTRTYPLLASRTFSALLFVAAGLTGCASDEGDASGNPYQPIDAGLTQDASPIVTTGGGGMMPVVTAMPSNDAGSTVKPLDAGTTMVAPTVDTGVVMPMGDAGVMMPTGDAGATPDAGGMMRPDQGMGDGKDVITIGDSWMNLDDKVGIQQSLEKVSKRDYRNFGVPGTKLLDEVIPNQYETAKKQGPIKTVIMTGGGNDILQDPALLLGGCLDPDWQDSGACPKRIDEVAARLQKLWAEMAMDGVQDVFIVGYSKKTNPLGLGTTAKSIAYSNMKIPPICDMVPAPLRCTALDTDMTVPDLTIRSSDGIHPTDQGYDLIGKAVWDVMQSKGMRR